MASAAVTYARNYRNQRVNAPVALFKKLAIQEASRQRGPASQRRRAYPEDYRRFRGPHRCSDCPIKEARMGKLTITIGVGDQEGRRFEDLEITVDTGSTFTALPKAMLERLGVPVHRTAQSRMADGRTVPVDIGWTMVQLEGQVFPTQVTFADEGEPPLLGAVTLREALLAVDPAGRRLIPVDVERI